jgi:N-acetylmuramoyl-L-alanine amidase
LRTGLRGNESSRIVIDADKPAEYNIFYLANPNRIVIDVLDADIGGVKKELADGSFVSDMRAGSMPGHPRISRFAADISVPARVGAHFALKPMEANKNHRIVVDLDKASDGEFARLASSRAAHASAGFDYPYPAAGKKDSAESVFAKPAGTSAKPSADSSALAKPATTSTNPAADLSRPSSASAKPATASFRSAPLASFANAGAASNRSGKKVIVIDPGHGGHDPGTIGRGGTKEKDIVLAVGIALRDILSANPNYRVIMTRHDDSFVPLRERAAIGERNHASIFVSIHADSSPRRGAQGFSNYTLDERATDEEARRIAEKENASDLLGVGTFDSYDNVTKNILGDLMQQQVKSASVDLAANIVRHMRKSVACLDRPQKAAPFVVLRSTIPSVLNEIGFLSNDAEERLLRTKAHRDKIAAALARAIDETLKD